MIKTQSKVIGCKINSQNSVALLHMYEKCTEKEVSVTTPFKIAFNDIKYIGLTVTKQTKGLLINCSSLLRKKLNKLLECGNISHDHGSGGLT